MRGNNLVGADVADADRLGYEADDVEIQLVIGEAADDATEWAGGTSP